MGRRFSAALSWAVGVTVLAAVVSRGLPRDLEATGVALCFAGATYWLVLRRDASTIHHFGVALGGLLAPEPLDWRAMALRLLQALGWTALLGAIFFPPYWAGFLEVWHPATAFRWSPPSLDEALGHVFAVAVPEELFYRGYCQTALDDALQGARAPLARAAGETGAGPHASGQADLAHAGAAQRAIRILGADLGPGVLLSSAVFAIGHLLTQPFLGRLTVFFPSLVFGWLRAKTGGVGASVLFHATCNLFAMTLSAGYSE